MTEQKLVSALQEMLDAAEAAVRVVSNLTFEAFTENETSQLAISMCFLRIGEQASKIHARYPEFIDQTPDIPWRIMRGMRNRIAHEYSNLNLEVVWSTLQADIPQLIVELHAVISRLEIN